MTSYIKPASEQTARTKYLASLDERLQSINILMGQLQENKNYTKIHDLEDRAEKIKIRINIAYDELNSRVESYIPGAVPFSLYISE